MVRFSPGGGDRAGPNTRGNPGSLPLRQTFCVSDPTRAVATGSGPPVSSTICLGTDARWSGFMRSRGEEGGAANRLPGT